MLRSHFSWCMLRLSLWKRACFIFNPFFRQYWYNHRRKLNVSCEFLAQREKNKALYTFWNIISKFRNRERALLSFHGNVLLLKNTDVFKRNVSIRHKRHFLVTNTFFLNQLVDDSYWFVSFYFVFLGARGRYFDRILWWFVLKMFLHNVIYLVSYVRNRNRLLLKEYEYQIHR